ncbi:glycosyltransferase family protein [Belnapia rosea]|uniref:Glycosyltransferase family 9 (Heptosyltransferase) n=1 Tax=Belnapia rosea TaxID=938405 RepID=A0A1G7D1T4_9PROT|nr:glycosyltransferase family 9 protein [Belnapia rosea]SDE45562.1 Glycosyltransferase family 9 (heptosyltransferase) [Belnapia rosea]
MRHMRRGDWGEAWGISDAVLRARDGVRDWSRPRHLQAVWDGTPVDGRRVLLRCYHGLGDTIQFIRFAPLVQARASELTVWAQPALIPLLRTMPRIGRLLPLHDGTPEVAYDVDVEVMELPHVLRTTIGTLPAQVPYLHLPRRDMRADAGPARPGLAVGLVWRSGDWDYERRSVPFGLLEPLRTIPGVALHILQRGPALEERPLDFGILSGSDDILEAALVMRDLDLVISIDSMPAHLAGALGLPVWTLLARDADWRWMEEREDSPWYPSMRLFRQRRSGAWGEVIARVADELRTLAARRLSGAA